MPSWLLHSRAGVCQLVEPAVDLGTGDREILELAIVQPVQGDARGVTLVARDYSRQKTVDEAAHARQPDCEWPSGGGRNSGQHRHGYVLSKSSRYPVSRSLVYRRPAASMVSAGFRAQA